MANRKTFGERNKELSKKLLKEKKYYDWVITTAFYSSIHFVEDCALPIEINGVKCKDISSVRRAYGLDWRHLARERLVFDQLGSAIGARYKWLDDNSRNARYKTYKVQSSSALKSEEYLDYIYKHCYSE